MFPELELWRRAWGFKGVCIFGHKNSIYQFLALPRPARSDDVEDARDDGV